MSKVYSYKNYDKYLCLKVGFGLWVVMLFLLRPYILLVSSFRIDGVRGAGGLKDLVYPDDLSLILGILATIPLMVVIYAWVKREPDASEFIRKVWRHGKPLLIASASMNILAIFIPVWAGFVRQVHIISWFQLGLSLLVVLYLYFSVRVKDTFADFPEREG